MVNLDGLEAHVDWPVGTSDSRLSPSNCGLCDLDMKDWKERNANPLDEQGFASSFTAVSSPRSVATSSSPRRSSSSMEQSASNTVAAKRHGADPRPTGNTTTSHDPDTGAGRRAVTTLDGEHLSASDDRSACEGIERSAVARAGRFHTGQTDHAASFADVLDQRPPADAPDVEQRRYFSRDLDHQTADDDVIRFTSGDPLSPTFCLVGATFSHPPTVTTLEFVDRQEGLAAGSTEHQTAPGMSAQLQTPVRNRAPDDEQQQQVMMMTEEKRRLHETKRCKVCADREADSVFLPCGHLVSCDRCSPQLRTCPVCETHVRGTVNSSHFSHKLNELPTSIM